MLNMNLKFLKLSFNIVGPMQKPRIFEFLYRDKAQMFALCNRSTCKSCNELAVGGL